MRKHISLILCIAMISALAGCGSNVSSGRIENEPAGVNDVLEDIMAEENGKKAETEDQDTESGADNGETRQNGVNGDAPKPEPADEAEMTMNAADGIDMDLTELSSTMVYSEVYNMMVTPENYIGKTVKMDGMFSCYHDEASDRNYYACIISDATACCSQGIEFVLTDEYSYPDDYPEEGGDICVVGVFDTYQEGDIIYCTLRNAKLV